MIKLILLDANNINDVVSILSPDSIMLLLTYFVPGFFFCFIFNYITKNNYKEISFSTVLISVVVSYVLNIAIRLIPKLSKSSLIIIINIVSLVIGIICSLIYKKLIKKDLIDRTLSDGSLNYMLMKLNKDSTVFVYAYIKNNNTMIYGQLSAIDESKTPNIVLENYYYCTIDSDMKIISYSEKHENSYCFLKYDSINFIDFHENKK